MAAAECNASMRAIVEALVALHAALSTPAIILSRDHITIQPDTDEDAERLAALLGVEVRRVTFEGKRWLDCGVQLGRTYVTVSGPHHKLEPAFALDEQAVAAAVDQANAAIAGASS